MRRISDNPDSMEHIMASVIHGEQQTLSKRQLKKQQKQAKKAAKNRPEQAWSQLEHTSRDSAAYKRGILGPTRRRNLTAPLRRPTNNSFTISIQFSTQPFKRLRRWTRAHAKLLFSLAGVGLLIVASFAGLKMWQSYNAKQDKVVTNTPLKPEKVFLPLDVPAGYEVVSTNQSLDNGALVYSVYNPEGEVITITQQAKPDDFDMKMFATVPSFTTPYGKAYIIEDAGRINGYIFDEKTWVLFNSTARVAYESMKELMLGLKPAEE